MFYLQKYKGKSTRHTCPSCKTKQSFTLYLNGNTHEPIHQTVGRCNREIKCGYHHTPKQYFSDNPSLSPPLWGGWVGSGVRLGRVGSYTSKLQTVNGVFRHPEHRDCKLPTYLVGSIPLSYLIDSLSTNSNFVSFIKKHFSEEQIEKIFENYLLGATKNKEVIFWQIDIQGKVRTGKIMQYNPETGRRLKHQSGAINWAHNKLKKTEKLPDDFNLQQCFFGEHLLKLYPDKTVAIVESEKSAIIASCIFPELIWLAAGNLNGLSLEKCHVLKGRDLMLYPDLGAFEKWSFKAIEIRKWANFKLSVSTLLESETNITDRGNGVDIADYILIELISKVEHL